jgi:hypothetical protein
MPALCFKMGRSGVAMARGDEVGSVGLRERRAIMEHIRLLCRSGAGLQAIIGPLCSAVRDLIGVSGAAIFWLNSDGLPGGFYHDSASAELKDFFISKIEELFIDPNEITMLSLIHGKGPSIGKMLRNGETERFWQGKIYQYLCAPLDHHHMIDMTMRRDGTGAALFCGWNPRHRPFTVAVVKLLEPVQRLIESALAADESLVKWQTIGDGYGHFMTDLSGQHLIAIHPEAEAVLSASHLLRQQVSMTQAASVAPSFALILAERLRHGQSAILHLPVANGRLVARASRTRTISTDSGDGAMMHVALHLEAATNALAVEYVMRIAVTPLQREIALFALTGGTRADCLTEFAVSDEALKKHLRPIFDTTSTARWADLATLSLSPN